MFDENRRKYPRVNYPCQLTMLLLQGAKETISAQSSNIGLGGLCVHLDKSMAIGIDLDIQINFTNPTTPFKCKGTVVRCQPQEKSYNIGIQFEPLSELKYAFLDGKVSELIALEKEGKS